MFRQETAKGTRATTSPAMQKTAASGTGRLRRRDEVRGLGYEEGRRVVHYSGSKENRTQPTNADQARAQYWALGEEGRLVFDKYAGINTAANPEVGGGYTMNTEYNMPGFEGGRRT